MKSVLSYLKMYIKESIFAPLFKLLEASFELIVPLVISKIIDVGIKRGDVNYILKCCGLLLIFAVVGMVMAITAQYFAAKAAMGFGKDLRHSLFSKIQSLTFSDLDTIGTSSLITRMTNDVNQVQSGINLVLRLFLRSPFIVIGATVMAFTIDARCALIFVVAIVLLSVVVFGVMGYTIPGYKKIQKNLDSVTLSTRENLMGARVIRAFTCEEDEYKKFSQKNEFLSHMQRSVGRVSAILNPTTYIIINVAVIVLIYTGAIKVNTGVLTQGQVVALFNYLSQILVELIKLANLIVSVTKSMACASRIEMVLELDSNDSHIDKEDNLVETDVSVEFKNVSLMYKNAGDKSLENISFAANKGDSVGIIGGTGSGKSSLVSLIGHFYDCKMGEVFVNGTDVRAYDDDKLRKKIGYVQQRAVLFSGTIRDNIKWGNPNATDDEIYEALKVAQMYDIVMDKGGLDAVVEQGGQNFSGGQKQRLSVARALVRKPEILILDDSSSALDYATESQMRKAISGLPYNPTVFTVSQRASSVMASDLILVLDDGLLVGAGKHSDLLNNCDAYKEIFASQFSKEV